MRPRRSIRKGAFRARAVRMSLTAVLLVMTSACTGDEPRVATNVDLARFQGRWYEIARIPRDHDRLCHDTVADYRSVAPGRLELTHRCRLGSPTGTPSEFRANASVDDPNVPAKLSIEIGLFRGAYWILEVGPAYEYAVIGHPSLTMLWILSRKPALDAQSHERALEVARREGFGTALLEPTPQSGAGTVD